MMSFILSHRSKCSTDGSLSRCHHRDRRPGGHEALYLSHVESDMDHVFGHHGYHVGAFPLQLRRGPRGRLPGESWRADKVSPCLKVLS